MEEEKLQGFHQSLLANPNIKGIPTDYSQFATVFEDPVKGDSFFKSLKSNPNIKGLPDTYDVFVSGLIQKTGGIEVPKTSGQFTPGQVSEFGNKSFLGKIGTGFKKSGIGMLGGIENMIAEYLPVVTVPGTALGNVIDPYQSYVTSEKLKEKALKNFQDRSEIYGKGGWFTLGTFGPLLAGTAASALLAPVTSGTSLAAIPTIISGATLAGMTADVIGNSLLEQDIYAKEHGREADPFEKNAVAWLSGAAMLGAGKIVGGSSKLITQQMGKAVSSVMKDSPELAVNLMRKYIAKNPQALTNVLKQGSMMTGKETVKSAAAMGLMTGVQDYLANIYKDPDDKQNFEAVVKDIYQSAKGGALLGAFLGPMGAFQMNKFNSMRRSSQGINIVQTKDGKVYERVGDDPKTSDKVVVLDEKLNTTKINRKDIVDGFSMNPEQKDWYLDAWKNHKETIPEVEDYIKKNAIYRQSMKIANDLAFQGPGTLTGGEGIGGLKEAGKFVRMIQDPGGESFFVTREMPGGETELAQLFPRGDGTYGVKKFTVKNLDYSKVTDMPVQDYANMAVDYYTNIKPSTPEGKAEGFTSPEEAAAPENAEATINNYGQNIKFNSNVPLSEDHNPMVVVASHKMDGRKFFVTGESGQNGDHIFTGFDADALREAGFDFTKVSPELIKASDIQDRMNIPYAQWLQNEVNLYQQTRQQSDQIIAQANAPVQEGQEVTLKDKNFVVTQTGQDGVILNEINEKGELTGESITVTPDKYGEVFGTPAPEGQQQAEQTLPADQGIQPEANQAENALVSTGAPAINEGIQQTPTVQPGLKTAKLGKTNITYQEQPDGSFLIPANATDDVEKMAKQVRNEIDTDNFDVIPITEEIPIPDVAPFAKVKTQKVATGIRIMPKAQTPAETITPAVAPPVSEIKPMSQEAPASVETAQVQTKLKEEPQNAKESRTGDQKVASESTSELEQGQGGGHNLRDNERKGIVEQQEQGKAQEVALEVKSIEKSPEEGVEYARRPDGTLKTKGEYTQEEWNKYTESVIDKKLSELPKQKEFWEMTKDDFINHITEKAKARGYELNDLVNKSNKKHKEFVSKAISERKPVPPEVLADYPELKQPDLPGEFTIESLNERAQRFGLSNRDMGTDILDYILNANEIGLKDDVAKIPKREWDQLRVDAFDIRINRPRRDASENREDKSSPSVDLTKANAEVDTKPTEAQVEAGNFKHGHLTVQGMEISIEKPAGSIRKGVDKTGKQWAVMLNNSYGYFRRTKGKDGDQIDVFLGDNLTSDSVYVIDQVDPKTGVFDEHKVMLGFNSAQDAKDNYLENYEPVWKGIGAISKMSVENFKQWLGDGTRTKKPVSKEIPVKPTEQKPEIKPEIVPAKTPEKPAEFAGEVLKKKPQPRNLYNFRKRDLVKNTITGKIYEIIEPAKGKSVNVRLKEKGGKQIENFNAKRVHWVPVQKEIKVKGKKRGPVTYKPDSDYGLALSKTPDNFEESVMQFFIGGGRVSTADFIRYMGFAPFGKEGYLWAVKGKADGTGEQGVPFDGMNEQIANSFGMEDQGAMAIENEIVRILKKYHTRSEMVAEILHRTDQNVSNEMSPEDIIDQMDDATPENVENIVPETVDNLLDKIVNSKEILSIFTSGRYTDDNGDIDWNKLKDLAENNHDYFTDFPFKLNETEFNNLKELLNDTARQREISQRVKSSNNAQGRGEENIIRAGTPAGQKGSGGNAEKPATRAEPAGEVKEYRYKMNARPFDIGTYPKEGFIKADNDPQGGFQILTYDRKLTAKERHHWSFLPLTEIDELRDKQFANKYGEFFVDLEWMGNNSGADVSMFDNKNQLVVKPFFMSTDEILKNIETGYWVEKQWEKPKETPKSDIDRINEILEKKPEEKPAKPNPPSQYSPIQQKQIDKINKDYSELIAKKQEAIVQAEKDIKDALLKADERNGLFGDVKPVEKDEIIKREEQGFTYNETTRAAVRKPFDEKIAELRKEIVELTLEQKGKIESVINQQDLFAMTPAEDNPAPIEPDNKESLPKLEDFGKKVGGARKDMGITRTVRDTDSLPAWRRKYSYANADGSIIIGQNVDTSVPFVVQWAKEIPTWTGKRTRYTLVTAVNSRDPKIFNSEEEAEAYIPIYEVWKQNFRVRKSGDNYVITKTSSTGKVIEYATFPTEEDANVYMYSTEGATSLLNHKREDFSIPALEKVERTGRDWRKGRDISTEEFMDTFGFRGGEFGNWVKPEERRVMLNAAYDSFMDLSEHLNIPPRTLSFGGELSIAFGARGTKGAAAHFEPDRAVINLTRMNGAGSLAHEWAHALDNYFGLQAAKKDYTRNEQGELKSPHVMRTSAGVFTQGMRKELSDLFDAIIDATQQKSVTRTMGMEEKQKAFDRVKERVQSEADSLLKKFENGVRRYQYNRKTKQREDVTIKGTPEQVKNVKVIIDKILTGEGERPKWSHIPESKGHLEFSYISPETLALDKLYKEVFGRTGLKQDGGGIYNLGYFADKMYPAKETFAKAVAGESETLKVPTDFLKTSKTFDASRANPYWSTKVEMFARAFEYFVETKLLDQNIRADYLQYDKAPVYEAVYGKNPYPAGEERTALNKLFQEFFGEIKVKTDENNVSLLYETNEEYIQGTLDGFDSEKQKQEAIDKAVKRAESQRLNPGRGAGSPLYPKIKPRTVLEGFKESGYIDFIGQKITSPQDVADLWSIHRSPNIEKAHAIFVKDGVIVGTTATTLNRNGMALFLDPSVILDLYNKFGADGVYYLHNHPSGNHKPSAADIIMTANHNKDLAPRGINIIGHIIIDTDKMSVIDVRERPVDLTNVTFSNDLDPYIENDVKVYEYKNSVPRLYSANINY